MLYWQSNWPRHLGIIAYVESARTQQTPPNPTLFCWVPSREVSGPIFTAFSMTRPWNRTPDPIMLYLVVHFGYQTFTLTILWWCGGQTTNVRLPADERILTMHFKGNGVDFFFTNPRMEDFSIEIHLQSPVISWQPCFGVSVPSNCTFSFTFSFHWEMMNTQLEKVKFLPAFCRCQRQQYGFPAHVLPKHHASLQHILKWKPPFIDQNTPCQCNTFWYETHLNIKTPGVAATHSEIKSTI